MAKTPVGVEDLEAREKGREDKTRPSKHEHGRAETDGGFASGLDVVELESDLLPSRLLEIDPPPQKGIH
ncbi:hypothetical protein Ct61P_00440 [Colletotrichum tofieldiae]|nr:hypothetical protein Ct61P_00440 [Colletotrichum tofieldiae]